MGMMLHLLAWPHVRQATNTKRDAAKNEWMKTSRRCPKPLSPTPCSPPLLALALGGLGGLAAGVGHAAQPRLRPGLRGAYALQAGRIQAVEEETHGAALQGLDLGVPVAHDEDDAIAVGAIERFVDKAGVPHHGPALLPLPHVVAHLEPAVAGWYVQAQVRGLYEVDVIGVALDARARGLASKEHLQRGRCRGRGGWRREARERVIPGPGAGGTSGRLALRGGLHLWPGSSRRMAHTPLRSWKTWTVRGKRRALSGSQ